MSERERETVKLYGFYTHHKWIANHLEWRERVEDTRTQVDVCVCHSFSRFFVRPLQHISHSFRFMLNKEKMTATNQINNSKNETEKNKIPRNRSKEREKKHCIYSRIIHLWKQKRKRSTTKYACKRITIHILTWDGVKRANDEHTNEQESERMFERAHAHPHLTAAAASSNGNSFTLMFQLDNSFVEFTSYHYRHRCQHNEQRNCLPFSLKSTTHNKKYENTHTYVHTDSARTGICVCVCRNERKLSRYFLGPFDLLFEMEEAREWALWHRRWR